MSKSYRFIAITNDPVVAGIFDRSGVTHTMVDLESKGKARRQPEGSWVSPHMLEDIVPVKRALLKSDLIVRVDSPSVRDAEQVHLAIAAGADAVMLPFFFDLQEVGEFCDQVAGRAKRFLLVETPESAHNLDAILCQHVIDYVHIGLNDLSLQLGLPFVFQALMVKEVDKAAEACRTHGVPFGVGGVARVGMFEPNPELIAVRHVQLGSCGVILNRSFCQRVQGANWEAYGVDFHRAVDELRDAFMKAEALTTDEIVTTVARLDTVINHQAKIKG